MPHEDCIFCKIIHGEIPSAKVYEDEHVYAFLDISQVTKGHTLVIPKQHVRNIYDTPADVAKELFARIPKIANAIKAAYQPVGINLVNNNEAPAGQTVFHLHIHLIPKYEAGKGYEPLWETHTDEYSQNDLQEIATHIQKQINE